MSQTTVRRSGRSLRPSRDPPSSARPSRSRFAAALAGPAAAQRITEVVFDHAGTDTHEYVEIHASPGASLSAYTLVELDGSAGGDPGKILHVFTPTTANGCGVLVDGLPDVDARAADVHDPPRLGVHGRGRGRPRRRERRRPRRDPVDVDRRRRRLLRRRARARGPTRLPSSAPASTATRRRRAARPASRTTATPTSVTDWKRNDFDGDGLPGFAGTLAPGEARNTPDSVTRVALADYYAGRRRDAARRRSGRRSTRRSRTTSRSRTRPATTDTLGHPEPRGRRTRSTRRGSSTSTRTRRTRRSRAGRGVYNREHSWPNSYGFPSDERRPVHGLPPPLRVGHAVQRQPRATSRSARAAAGARRTPTILNHGFGGGSGDVPGQLELDDARPSTRSGTTGAATSRARSSTWTSGTRAERTP